MNSGPIIFVGLFATMACTWSGFVLAPQVQLGDMNETNTVAQGTNALPQTYPVPQPGNAHAGAEIYRANGCAACHTQVIRPLDLGSDIHRGWGHRRSVAEDYLYDQPTMIGSQRVGPDLANYGRRASIEGIYLQLYDPPMIATGSVMPPYRFLFETHKIGLFPSPDAISLPDQDAAPVGYEIIPRPAAKALAAYLLSLHQDGYLYEAPPPPSKTTNAVSTNAVPATTAMPAK